MSIPRVPVPFREPSTYDHSVGLRKERQKRLAVRLKFMEWLTIPQDAFLSVGEYGMALYPRNPIVRWYWDLKDFGLYQSDALIWMGFWRGSLPVPTPAQ